MVERHEPQIGDVYEIRVAGGLAYFQYTHSSHVMGYLVRVLPGIYSERPIDITALVNEKELYFIFLNLLHAQRKKEILFVGNKPVPEWAQSVPTMRKPAGRTREGKIVSWHIGDPLRMNTVEEMREALYVRDLTSDQENLSILELWPAPTLAAEIGRGWLPQRNEEFEDANRKKAAERKTSNDFSKEMKAQFIDHYFYFPQRNNADTAAERLRSKGWTVDVRMGADGRNWLALAKQPAPIDQDIGDLRDELEELANELGGEYDGWGSAI